MPENPVEGTKKAEFRELPVPLTIAEVAECADSLAINQGQIDQIELEKAEDSAHHNRRLKSIRGSMVHTAKQIRDRQRIESVEVGWSSELGTKMMILCRLDTGEELSRREMTEAERQRSLFHVEPTIGVGDPSRLGGDDPTKTAVGQGGSYADDPPIPEGGGPIEDSIDAGGEPFS